MNYTKNYKRVKIDGEKLREAIKAAGHNCETFSEYCGFSRSFMSRVCKSGDIAESAYKLVCYLLGQDEEEFIVKEPEPVKEMPTASVEVFGNRFSTPMADGEISGYTVKLSVWPDKVGMVIEYDGKEVQRGYSRIRGMEKLDLFQAISYAAHSCYKNCEQEVLSNA